eukprot:6360363-Amphidinium_carterae.1
MRATPEDVKIDTAVRAKGRACTMYLIRLQSANKRHGHSAESVSTTAHGNPPGKMSALRF